MNKLKAKGILTAADVNKSLAVLEQTNGIGIKTFGSLFNWSQRLRENFSYIPDQQFLAKEQKHLVKYIEKQRKFLMKVMDKNCANY